MKIVLSLVLLLTTINIFAQQSQRQILQFGPEQYHQNRWWDIPVKADPFLAFSASWESTEQEEIYFRFGNEQTQSDWQLLQTDEHFMPTDDKQVSQLIFASKDWASIQLRFKNPEKVAILRLLTLHFYSPGNDSSIESTRSTDLNALANTRACPCPQPTFLDRAGWCPNGDCPEHPSPEFTAVTHLIVHHAATTNVSSNWSGVVRSIWDYHVNTNGWSDIGYNWLIDPNGVLYEGRGDNILGAHFCSRNAGTAGTCMLGDFTKTTPTVEALDQLKKLLSWKVCDANIDPLGSGFHASSDMVIPFISGHRDGCNTECPGDQFYPLLPQLRQDVKNHITNQCSTTATHSPEAMSMSMEVFPNPGSGLFQLFLQGNYQGEVQVELSGIAKGQVLKKWNFKKNELEWQTLLECGAMPSGVYLLKVKTEDQLQTLKIIVL